MTRTDAGVRELLEDHPDMVLGVSVDGVVQFANRSVMGVLEHRPEDICGRALSGFVHGDDHAGLAAALARARAEGRLGRTTLRVKDARATWRVVEFVGWRSVAQGWIILSGRDYAACQAREDAARHGEERYRAIVENARDGIWTVDAQARTTFVNRAMARMLGYEPDDLLGRRYTDFIHPEERADADDRFLQRQMGVDESFERRFRHKDGDDVWTEVSTCPTVDKTGAFSGATALVTDVGVRRRLTAQLLHAQKMDAVGTLAAGLGGEFNNLLGGIVATTELLAYRFAANPDVLGELHGVRLAADRAAGLLRRLLTFARRQPVNPRDLDLRDIVGSAHRILASAVGDDVDLLVDTGTEACGVKVDPILIEQVLLSLVINARDALPDGRGRIEVTLQKDLNDVVLSVRDNGVGMSADVERRIFEPFFSTKHREASPGLGLAVVYGIVTAAGGSIAVTTSAGSGSTFTVRLPHVVGSGFAEHPEAADESPRGSETILVVEDDEIVRGITVRTLRQLGYRILLAEDGQDAIGVAAGHKGVIDLVVTDVVMPRLDGVQMVDRLRVDRPALRAIFVSGYSESTLESQGRGAGAVSGTFLDKPFTARTLARRVRTVLNGEEP